MRTTAAIYVLVVALVGLVGCPPVDPAKETSKEKEHAGEINKVDQELDDLGLEYGRYLQEVVAALEEDKDFAKKLENVSMDHIKSGAIAHELNFVDHNVRSKLDELKRIEMDRLRKLTKKEHDLRGMRQWRTINGEQGLASAAEHINHDSPHTFEVEDLHKLILAATKDLEALDAKRREEFKEYEMEKELKYQDKLTNLTETEKKSAIEQHDQAQKKHGDHARVHHPGSKAQLEQVWSEQDKMPQQEFDPKTFFALHDVNGDGVLDQQEVEALLSLEIKKMYDPEHNPEDDPNEMMEEYARMREHIYRETDKDHDGLISRKEFLDMTASAEFNKDDGWKSLDEEPQYSKEELAAYQVRHQQMLLHQQQQQMLAMQQQGMYHPGMGQPPYGQHPGAYGHPDPGYGGQHPAAYGQPQYGAPHPQGGIPPHMQQQQQYGGYQGHPDQGYQAHPGGQFQQQPQLGHQQQPQYAPQVAHQQQPQLGQQQQQHPQLGQQQQFIGQLPAGGAHQAAPLGHQQPPQAQYQQIPQQQQQQQQHYQQPAQAAPLQQAQHQPNVASNSIPVSGSLNNVNSQQQQHPVGQQPAIPAQAAAGHH